MTKLSLLILTILFTSSSFALDKEAAISNLASELSECTAYYLLLSGQLEKQNKDSSDIKKSGGYAYSLAEMISNKKVTKARIELHAKVMLKEIENNWSNGAILIHKYGESCKEILESPENRIEYWLSKL